MADLLEHPAKTAPSNDSGGGKSNKRKQTVIAAASVVLIGLAYLTYRRTKGSSTAAATGAAPATITPVTTATDVPSGTPAPDTTVPFAPPTNTTGAGTAPTNPPGTEAAGAVSSGAKPLPVKVPVPPVVSPHPDGSGIMFPGGNKSGVIPHAPHPPAHAAPIVHATPLAAPVHK